MTLHTRVAVTSGDVTPEAVFAQCRSIIGADKHQVIKGDPLAMAPGQGLPALMWVESSNGEPETCNEWCEWAAVPLADEDHERWEQVTACGSSRSGSPRRLAQR